MIGVCWMWWDGTVGIEGPYRIAAAQFYVPGIKQGEVYVAGPRAVQVYVAGVKAGEGN